MPISYAILKEQNASTSNAIIEHYESNDSFRKLAKFEGDSTIQRDNEDDSKLAKGIAFAQQKGVLDPHHVPQPYTEIDVLGKTPGEVADIIMNNISDGSTTGRGSVIVLCGLSGTGKVRINANVHLKLGRKNLSSGVSLFVRVSRALPSPSSSASWKNRVKRLCLGRTETFSAPSPSLLRHGAKFRAWQSLTRTRPSAKRICEIS